MIWQCNKNCLATSALWQSPYKPVLTDTMRYEGKVISWNEVRGFGFIEPALGGQHIFVHVKAFDSRSAKPRAGQAVTFEIVPGRDGKQRALRVQTAYGARSAKLTQKTGRTLPSLHGYFAVAAFVIMYGLTARLWHVPVWVAGCYLGLSVLCFIFYAIDKAAAIAGRRRTPESTLLLLGLLGGWPGAAIAQQLLRHKSRKPAFQAAFWGSVAVNVVAFMALCSPLISRLYPGAGF